MNYFSKYFLDSTSANFIHNVLLRKDINIFLLNTLKYTFPDVLESQVTILKDILLNLSHEKSTNAEYVKAIYDWYTKLDKKYVVGFEISNDEYNRRRILDIIKPLITLPKDFRNKTLLDIGAGDGVLSRKLGASLGLKRVVALDIESSTNIPWDGPKCETKSENGRQPNVSKVYYNGNNLKEAVRGNGDYGIITYNHSLHHFPSFKDQHIGLQQATEILSPGGFILLKEHDNILYDDQLNLQHFLLHLRYGIDNKQFHDVDTAIKGLNNYIKEAGNTNYLSRDMLIKIAQTQGLILVGNVRQKTGDIARNIYLCFQKPEKGKFSAPQQTTYFEEPASLPSNQITVRHQRRAFEAPASLNYEEKYKKENLSGLRSRL